MLFAEIGITYQDICSMTMEHFFIITNILKYRNLEREKQQKKQSLNNKGGKLNTGNQGGYEFAGADYIQSLINKTNKKS